MILFGLFKVRAYWIGQSITAYAPIFKLPLATPGMCPVIVMGAPSLLEIQSMVIGLDIETMGEYRMI